MEVEVLNKMSNEQIGVLILQLDESSVDVPRGNTVCREWKTTSKSGYIKKSVRGNSFYVHRLALFIGTMTPPQEEDLEVSHLCHVKRCIRFDHLSLEPQHVNRSRKTCVLLNKCCGHPPYKNCLLVKKESVCIFQYCFSTRISFL